MQRKGLFGLHFMSQLLSEGNQGRNLNVEEGPEAKTTEAHCLLACSACFFLKKNLSFFISYIMCEHLCVGICMSAVPEEAKSISPLGSGGGYKWCDVGAWN